MNSVKPTNNSRSLLGILAFLLAVVTAGSVAMIGFTSFTAFDPPGWLRIITMAPSPVTLFASVGFGLAGFKKNSGRLWAIAGLVLAALTVVAFIVMISFGG